MHHVAQQRRQHRPCTGDELLAAAADVIKDLFCFCFCHVDDQCPVPDLFCRRLKPLLAQLMALLRPWMRLSRHCARAMPCVSRGAATRRASGVTYQYQAELPALPIPELDHTLQHYLLSLRPLLLTDEASGRAMYDDAKVAVEAFMHNEGPVLQDRLRAHAATQDNWLEVWWDEGYLTARVPCEINVNYAFILSNEVYPSEDHHGSLQTSRAARLVAGALEFKRSLDRCVPRLCCACHVFQCLYNGVCGCVTACGCVAVWLCGCVAVVAPAACVLCACAFRCLCGIMQGRGGTRRGPRHTAVHEPDCACVQP